MAAASESQLGQNRKLALLIAAEAYDESILGGAEPYAEAVSALAHAIQDWKLVSHIPAGPLTFPPHRRMARWWPCHPRPPRVTSTCSMPRGRWSAPLPVRRSRQSSPGPWISADGENIAVMYANPLQDAFRSVPAGVPDVVIFDLANISEILDIDSDHGWKYATRDCLPDECARYASPIRCDTATG